jgi:transcription elongation factor Elf1
MAGVIDTLGKAGRHRMLVVAECRRCGRRAQFYAEELATFYGRGRDPLSLKFRCTPCASTHCSITLIEQSFERTHEKIVWRPVKVKER